MSLNGNSNGAKPAMIRVGVIGYGYWGPNVVRNFFGVDHTCVEMLCDMNPSALARAKKKVHVAPQCVDRPEQFSLGGLFFNPKPQPNGCAPPVYQYGQYIGQDPDANIRAYMKKDVWTGYAPP